MTKNKIDNEERYNEQSVRKYLALLLSALCIIGGGLLFRGSGLAVQILGLSILTLGQWIVFMVMMKPSHLKLALDYLHSKKLKDESVLPLAPIGEPTDK